MSDDKNKRPQRRIYVTLAIYGFAIAIGLGLIASIVQISQDFRAQNEQNDKSINTILNAFSDSFSRHDLDLGSESARRRLSALLNHDFVIDAETFDANGASQFRVTQPTIKTSFDAITNLISSSSKEYEIDLTSQETGSKYGSLKLTVHSSTILQNFILRALKLIIWVIFASFLLALLLGVAVYFVISRPLNSLGHQLSQADPYTAEPLLLPREVSRSNNEITAVASQMNGILKKSKAHLDELSDSRTAADRISAELKHAERLSVIGQLTGGVAHDFNNVLAIILGNLELLKTEALSERGRKFLDVALLATNKGANLTDQLLAYSRKQPLSPKPVVASKLFHELEQLLRRTLGEQISLEFVLASGLWVCEADRRQLETVILNLAINSRDAMPDGGNLTIEAFNARLDLTYTSSELDLSPGQYVCFAITDSGCGMSDEVMEKAFEPFFSTKPSGKGSGLGLSMAFGFAKQSGGHIRIYSEQGEGTTIRLYLPRYHGDEVDGATSQSGDTVNQLDLTGRTVLIVEDDEAVLQTIGAHLDDMGASIVTARNGDEAMLESERHENIDIFLIDVMLPGKGNGRDLANALSASRGHINVAFMSGYTENAIIHNARLDRGVVLLQKPFSRTELTQVLNSFLNK